MNKTKSRILNLPESQIKNFAVLSLVGGRYEDKRKD